MKRTFTSLAMAAVVAYCVVTPASAQRTPLVRQVDLKYTVEILEIPAGAKAIDLWIPVPT